MPVWIPPDSDFALALREPNLLVPNKRPIGSVKSAVGGSLFTFSHQSRFNDLSRLRTPSVVNGNIPITNDGAAFNGTSGYLLVGDIAPYTSGAPWSIIVALEKITGATEGKIASFRAGSYNANGFDLTMLGGVFNLAADTVGISSFACYTTGTNLVACFRYDGSTGYIDVLSDTHGRFDHEGTVTYTPTSGNYACLCGRNHNGFRTPLGTVSLLRYFDSFISESEVNRYLNNKYYGLDPANDTPYLFPVAAAGGGVPTLSSPGVINVLSDRATPQVTLTF